MTADTSVIGLILEASIPVMLVMILLVLASLVSWSIIFAKRKLIRRTKDASDEFEASFWSGGDLNTLYRAASQARGGVDGDSATAVDDEEAATEQGCSIEEADDVGATPVRLFDELLREKRKPVGEVDAAHAVLPSVSFMKAVSMSIASG